MIQGPKLSTEQIQAIETIAHEFFENDLDALRHIRSVLFQYQQGFLNRILGILDEHSHNNSDMYRCLHSIFMDVLNICNKEIKVPKGAKKIDSLVDEWGIDKKSLVVAARVFIDKRSVLEFSVNGCTYYAKELVAKLRRKFSEPIPHDWITAFTLSKELKVARETVLSIIYDQRREGDIDEFKLGQKDGRIALYFSPTIADFLRKILAFDEIPDGWITANKLCEELSYSRKTIIKIMDGYKSERHCDHFRIGKSGVRRVEYYSPALVRLLKYREKKEFSKEGWMTTNQLRQILGCHHRRISEITKDFERDSRYVAMKEVQGLVVPCYSPELQKILLERYGSEQLLAAE